MNYADMRHFLGMVFATVNFIRNLTHVHFIVNVLIENCTFSRVAIPCMVNHGAIFGLSALKKL